VLEEKAEDLGRVLGPDRRIQGVAPRDGRVCARTRPWQKVLAEAEGWRRRSSRSRNRGRTDQGAGRAIRQRAPKRGNPIRCIKQMVVAQSNFEKLMARINARIYEGIKKGAASPIITLG